ncbi:hypothetical protein [Allokutzneria sp. NRRL B-24872]|uniref:hypothetical protein n=1 Tax=Allokutzneria sp. NRRL B-24872 TaxID=1137961 RepID=UPI0011777D27|nr:hypothetical protein [Allokutzneria sp. NRRL B-24872]
MSDPGLPQRFLDLLQQAGGPASSFGGHAGTEIETGQLWRARWDGDRVLVLILSVEGRDVIGAPVTLDPPAEDDLCLVVDESRNGSGVPATLWAGLTGPVPIRVLDQPVEQWGQDIVHWAATAVPVPAEEVPPGTRRGRAIDSALEPAAEVRAELDDTLDRLRLAPALPVVKPGDAPITLAALLGKGPKIDLLRSALGLPQHEVMKLLSGTRPLTPDLAAVVAAETGLSTEDVTQAVLALPPELVSEVEHPRWRTTWTDLAGRDGVDEATARLTASYGTFALAGRQTGGAAPDWRGRVRQFLSRPADPEPPREDH